MLLGRIRALSRGLSIPLLCTSFLRFLPIPYDRIEHDPKNHDSRGDADYEDLVEQSPFGRNLGGLRECEGHFEKGGDSEYGQRP